MGLLMAFCFSCHLGVAKLVQDVYITIPYFLFGSSISELITGIIIVWVSQESPLIKNPKDIPWLILCGMLYGGLVVLIIAALAYTTAVEVLSLYYFNPILAVIIGFIAFRDKFGIPAIVGMIVFIAGVVVIEKPPIIFGGEDFEFTTDRKIGWALAIGAGICGGSVLNVIRGLGDRVSSTVMPLFAYGAQIVFVFPFLFFNPVKPDGADTKLMAWVLLFIVGVIAGMAEVLFCRTAQLISAGYAGTLESTLILWGTFWGWLFAHEAITWNVGVGCVMMISGIAAIGIDQNR